MTESSATTIGGISRSGMMAYYMLMTHPDIFEKFKAYGLTEEKLKFEMIPKEGHWHITWRKSFALVYPWLMN